MKEPYRTTLLVILDVVLIAGLLVGLYHAGWAILGVDLFSRSRRLLMNGVLIWTAVVVVTINHAVLFKKKIVAEDPTACLVCGSTNRVWRGRDSYLCRDCGFIQKEKV